MARPETIDHSHDGRVELAAIWIASLPREQITGSIVATIRERFGLSAREACATAARIREARYADAS